MITENGSTGRGLTFLEALQLLFIALRLTGSIDWPWFVVLLPFEIALAFIFIDAVLSNP